MRCTWGGMGGGIWWRRLHLQPDPPADPLALPLASLRPPIAPQGLAPSRPTGALELWRAGQAGGRSPTACPLAFPSPTAEPWSSRRWAAAEAGLLAAQIPARQLHPCTLHAITEPCQRGCVDVTGCRSRRRRRQPPAAGAPAAFLTCPPHSLPASQAAMVNRQLILQDCGAELAAALLGFGRSDWRGVGCNPHSVTGHGSATSWTPPASCSLW